MKERRTKTLNISFLGSRGEIDIRSRCHRRHGSLVVQGGSSVVRGDARKLKAALRQFGREHRIEATFASDGHKLALARGRQQRWARKRA